MDVMGDYSPLGIATGGNRVFLHLLTSEVGDEVMWSVAPLSLTNWWRQNNACDKREEAVAALALGLAGCAVPLPYMIDKICWSCKLESPCVTDGMSEITGPSLTLLVDDWWLWLRLKEELPWLDLLDACLGCSGGYPFSFQHVSHTWWSRSQ